MSVDPISVSIEIPADISCEEIQLKLPIIINEMDMQVNDELSDRNHLYLKDNLYLYLYDDSLLSASLEVYLRTSLIAADFSQEKPLIEDWFYDKRLERYNLIALSIYEHAIMHTKPINTSDENYGRRIVNITKELHARFNGIRTTAYQPMYLYEEDEWCDNEIFFNLCNRDIVFHNSIWFAIVNPDYYGGEQNFKRVLRDVYEVWTRLYRQHLEKEEVKKSNVWGINKWGEKYKKGEPVPEYPEKDKEQFNQWCLEKWQEEYETGVPVPEVERLPNGHLFFERYGSYGLECEIDKPYNKEMKQLFEKLLHERMKK